MKTNIALGAVFIAALIAGCGGLALEKNIKIHDGSKSLRVCVGLDEGEECGEGFAEINADIIPWVGGIANTVLTCVRYEEDQNISCPPGTIQISNVDVVK